MLNAPEGATELCTIDGITYVSIPDGVAIDSDQHEYVLGTMDAPVLDDELRANLLHRHTSSLSVAVFAQ